MPGAGGGGAVYAGAAAAIMAPPAGASVSMKLDESYRFTPRQLALRGVVSRCAVSGRGTGHESTRSRLAAGSSCGRSGGPAEAGGVSAGGRARGQ